MYTRNLGINPKRRGDIRIYQRRAERGSVAAKKSGLEARRLLHPAPVLPGQIPFNYTAAPRPKLPH